MVLLLTLAITSIELILVEIKYEIFRGGFLQSHPIVGFGYICFFILCLFLSTLLLLSFLQSVFFSFFVKREIQQPILVYHFIWLVGGGILLAIGVRYELGRYFSDFLDFQVVKNLGGGNFDDALVYVLDEGLAYGAILLLILTIYAGGHFYMRYILKDSEQKKRHDLKRNLRWTGLVMLLQSGLIIVINQNSDFRHHLSRTTAYQASRKVLDWLTDFDNDGYGLFAWQPDSEPFNNKVYPLALDIPNDGIDQDGIGGDFQYSNENIPGQTIKLNADLNVVVIVLESTRADSLEQKVDGQKAMPNLLALAQEGSSAKMYYSHTAYTTSSLSTMFTGRLAPNEQFEHSIFRYFKEAGYQIGVFSGQAESFGDIDKHTGMHRFAKYFFDAESAKADRVFPSAAKASLKLSNDRVVDELFKVGIINREKPFFAYINLQAGHFPYYYNGMPLLLIKAPFPRDQIQTDNRSRLLEAYYNAMAYNDQAIGRIVMELKRQGIYEKTLIVVAGDHGESLFDDGFLGHGHFINDVQMQTLLVSNKVLPGLDKPLGQVDFSRILLSQFQSFSIQPLESNDGVFHYIGALHHPTLIGMTYGSGDNVILNIESREIQTTSKNNVWLSENDWNNDPVLKEKVARLISYWETVRWQDWLAVQPQ